MKKLLLLSAVLTFVCLNGFAQAPGIHWQKALGGTANESFPKAIEKTVDGGYVVTGYTASNNGDVTGNHGAVDFWVVKLDVAGNIIWQKTLGGTGSDQATSVVQTTDGGYIVAGYTTSNDGDVTGNHGGED